MKQHNKPHKPQKSLSLDNLFTTCKSALTLDVLRQLFHRNFNTKKIENLKNIIVILIIDFVVDAIKQFIFTKNWSILVWFEVLKTNA